MKSSIFITIIFICVFLVAPDAGAQTQVAGEIRNNTTWTKAGSPYVLIRTVEIPRTATLTIEPGVTVIMDGAFDMFSVKGKISAQGTAEEKIVFDGGGNSTFFNALNSTSLARVDLEYCEIKNGLALWKHGFGSFNLRRSLVENLSEGSSLYFPADDVVIEYNEFRRTGGFSIQQGKDNEVRFRHNLFNGKHPELSHLEDYMIENAASFENSRTTVEFNSFINMSGPVISLKVGSPQAKLTVVSNYWGTADRESIAAMINDKNDNPALAGFIEFEPFLSAPHPDTPDIARPDAPVIDAVTTPTDSSAQVITGTKPADTALWLNGEEIMSLGADILWTYQAELDLGENHFSFAVKDENGAESRAAETAITRVAAICASWTYSEWSACADGLETRTVLAAAPEGCVGGEPVLSRPCGAVDDEPDTAEGAAQREKRLAAAVNTGLAQRLGGRIVLQVEEAGEAWYINPDDKKKYYLGRPADAFSVMRRFGLGATHEFITGRTLFPAHVLGKILLDVERNGEAYYINPQDRKAYYLGRSHDAFRIMRDFGLGITNKDLRQIEVGELK